MKSKAIFLLMIFLLNTLIGFGCAIGMERGHHGQDHHHPGQAGHHKAGSGILARGTEISKTDHCCEKLVNDLVVQSKLIPQTGKVCIVLPVAFLPDPFYAPDFRLNEGERAQVYYKNYRCKPPDKDIRIIIQSFQI